MYLELSQSFQFSCCFCRVLVPAPPLLHAWSCSRTQGCDHVCSCCWSLSFHELYIPFATAQRPAWLQLPGSGSCPGGATTCYVLGIVIGTMGLLFWGCSGEEKSLWQKRMMCCHYEPVRSFPICINVEHGPVVPTCSHLLHVFPLLSSKRSTSCALALCVLP